MKFSSPRCLGLTLLMGTALLTAAPQAGPVAGEVLAVHRDQFQLEVALDGTDGAQTVFVGPGDAAIAEPGDAFRGRLVRQGPNWRLETIFPAEPHAVGQIERLGSELQRDTLRRGRKAFRAVGERIPVFALWDQNGDLFHSESLKGRYAVINFIFSRCAVQTMCPASTARMIELAEAVKERGWEDVRLVSITLDPAYDTPGIWTAYAEAKGIDGALHALLGGPPETVDALKKQMGVLAEPDPQQIVRHTMSTALVDPTGKIIYRLPGSMWRPETFLEEIAEARTQTGS
ncbi:MAG: SCO family protein [Verrucomicrobiota bacterium]